MASLRMARRFTRGGAARLALTVLAVAWGVALVAAVRLANHAVLRAFVEVIDTMAGRAALEVVAGEGGLFPEDVAAAVGATPGVEVAVPCVKGAAFAEGGALLTVYGVDLTGDATERVYGARLEVDDPQAFLARPDSIAVARPFAAARGLRPGDRLELTTPGWRRRSPGDSPRASASRRRPSGRLISAGSRNRCARRSRRSGSSGSWRRSSSPSTGSRPCSRSGPGSSACCVRWACGRARCGAPSSARACSSARREWRSASLSVSASGVSSYR